MLNRQTLCTDKLLTEIFKVLPRYVKHLCLKGSKRSSSTQSRYLGYSTIKTVEKVRVRNLEREGSKYWCSHNRAVDTCRDGERTLLFVKQFTFVKVLIPKEPVSILFSKGDYINSVSVDICTRFRNFTS